MRRSDLSINRRGVQIISLISAITLTLISLELIETILLNIGVPAHLASDASDLILVILFYGLLIMAGYLLPYPSWKTGSLGLQRNIVKDSIDAWDFLAIYHNELTHLLYSTILPVTVLLLLGGKG